MARTVHCDGCEADVETKVAAGRTIDCPTCGERIRVPLAKRTSKAAQVICESCGELTWTTKAPGQTAPCRSCGAPIRVGLRPQDEGRSVGCPECQSKVVTTQLPGKYVTCGDCSTRFRVPLGSMPGAQAAPQAQAAETVAGVSRTCPACGERVRTVDGLCPECGVDVDAAVLEKRYGGGPALREDERNVLKHGIEPVDGVDYLMRTGVSGGLALMTIAVVWFVCGWLSGIIFFYPMVLFPVGLVTFLGGLSRHRWR